MGEITCGSIELAKRGAAMNSDIERLARALIDRIGSPWAWEDMPDEVKQLWAGHVRAILSELRKPTEGMISAGQKPPPGAPRYSHLAADSMAKRWQTMISHLLRDGE